MKVQFYNKQSKFICLKLCNCEINSFDKDEYMTRVQKSASKPIEFNNI